MTDAAAPSTSPSNQDQLADRLDGRARRLRRQAHWILGIIIAVLVAGGAAFVFANQIVSLDLKIHPAADQYAAVRAELERVQQEQGAIYQRINEIQDTRPIAKPFEDQLNGVRAEVSAIGQQVVSSCESITYQSPGDLNVNLPLEYSVHPSADRLGEYVIILPMRQVYFSNADAASRCSGNFSGHVPEIMTLFRRFQDITRERDDKVREFSNSKSAETAPLQKKAVDLNEELSRLNPIVAETGKRATEERVLGTPLGEEKKSDQSQAVPKSTDWAQIIQSNLTRVSLLGIMFFLVAVLVPQYRYNIRMAAFYDARADSIRLAGPLEPITHLQDFEKIILAMTPNIDFGKAPATPIDQVVELVKAAKQ